jgi:hypothetical protein
MNQIATAIVPKKADGVKPRSGVVEGVPAPLPVGGGEVVVPVGKRDVRAGIRIEAGGRSLVDLLCSA